MIRGIRSGMVLQRDEQQYCKAWFWSDEEIKEARCLTTGQPLNVEKDDDRYVLRGLYVGGPYEIQIGSEVFENVYVGDLWLLAGQSNMQGVGCIDHGVAMNTDPNIRAFYMDDRWDMARHPLHEMGIASYGVHRKYCPQREVLFTRLTGPGISFARRMYELTGAPQGLIACAHGGTGMNHWEAEDADKGTDESLYAAMLARFHENGSHVRGLFWYQGCNETVDEARPLYLERMERFVRILRRDVGDIPIVQCQIGRFIMPASPIEDQNWQSWSEIRQKQLELAKRIPRMDTVYTIGLEMADDIHLEGVSQENLGRDAAESMYYMLYGRLYGVMPGIRLEKAECYEDEALHFGMSTVMLAYDNVHGELTGGSRPQGFAFSTKPDSGFYMPLKTWTDGRYVFMRVSRKPETIRDSYLWYGVGHEPPCNILDSRGRSLPAFGPLSVKELLKDE